MNGCLRCDSENNCLYCDVLEGYYLEGQLCEKSTLKNCQLKNENNLCLKCNQGYYLDPFTNLCIKLIPQVQVENCYAHLGPNYCQTCQKGFYALRGACVQISSPIQNCEVENARAECERCLPGFIRSIDRKSCGKRPEIANCETYANIQCLSCRAGYVYNENYYLDFMFGFDNSYQISRLNSHRNMLSQNYNDVKRFFTCQKTEIDFCEVYRDFESCKKCQDGYVLDERLQCTPKPRPIIPNCRKYSGLSSCVECEQGYYPETPLKCQPVTLIQNCQFYKQSVSNSICAECLESYYLSAENLCTKRGSLSEIELCEELAYNFEKCTRCRPGYIPTSDGFRCLAEIDHCETYLRSSKNDTLLYCNTCAPGYFYNEADRVCLAGDVQLCDVYRRTENKCAVCQEKFYLKNNRCHAQVSIKNCEAYSGYEKDVCQECNQHNFLFLLDDFCLRVNEIENCLHYEPNGTCRQCQDGYTKLRDYPTCFLIPPQENCLQKHEDQCVKCKRNYALDDGRCFIPSENMTHGCDSHNADGTTRIDDLKCDYCKDTFVPVDYQGSYVCTRADEFQRRVWGEYDYWRDPKCLQYKIDETQTDLSLRAVCEKCAEGYMIVGNRCHLNCFQVDKQTLYKEKVELLNLDEDYKNESVSFKRYNVCDDTIPNCKVAALNVFQDFHHEQYTCQICNGEYLPVMDLDRYGGVSLNDNVQRHTEYVSLPTTAGPGVSCVDAHKPDGNGGFEINVIGNLDPVTRIIPHCEYYNELTPGVLGCQRCQHGFGGKVIQLIKKCRVFESFTKCLECEQGFYLRTKDECRPVSQIDNCSLYDPKASSPQCQRCHDDFYVGADGKCTERVLSRGKSNCEFTPNADNCTCQTGYVQNQSDLQCFKLPDYCDVTSDTHKVVNNAGYCMLCDSKIAYMDPNSAGTCLKGSIEHCAQYQPNQDSCISCKNGHYMKNQRCEKTGVGEEEKPLDKLCAAWSITSKDSCTGCKPGAKMFQKVNQCVKVQNVIPHCQKYQDTFSCLTCEEGFYLNNVGSRCLEIPPEKHCKIYVPVEMKDAKLNIRDYTSEDSFAYTCLKCEDKYFRRQKNIQVVEKTYTQPDGTIVPGQTRYLNLQHCVDELLYMREFCKVSDTTEDNNLNVGEGGCSQCADDYYPYDFTGKYLCLDRTYLHSFKNTFVNDPKCSQYKYENNDFVCEECKNGYFMNGSTCVDSTGCTGGTHPQLAYIDDTTKKLVKNVCKDVTTINGSVAVAQCNIYTFGYKANAVKQICFKCDSGKVPFVTLAATDYAGYKTQYNNLENTDPETWHDLQLGVYYPEVSCQNAEAILGLDQNKEGKIRNCALYHKNVELGCLRCNSGYTGRVFQSTNINYIDYCRKDDTCVNDFTHTDITSLATHSGPLTQFLSCSRCVNPEHTLFVGFKVNDGSTTKRIQYVTGFERFYFGEVYRASNTDVAFTAHFTAQSTLGHYPSLQKQTFCADASALTYVANGLTTPTTAQLTTHFQAMAEANSKISPKDNGVTTAGIVLLGVNRVVVEDNGNSLFYPVYRQLACMPGYHLYEQETTWTCTRVTDKASNPCATSHASNKQLNGCGQCTWEMTQITDEFVSYIPSSSQFNATTNNCLSADRSTTKCVAGYYKSGAIHCKICEKGYELFEDASDGSRNKCYKLESSMCSLNNYFDYFNSNFRVHGNYRFQTPVFAAYQTNLGCNKCLSDEYVKVKITDDLSQIDRSTCSRFVDGAAAVTKEKFTIIEKNKDADGNDQCQSYGRKQEQLRCKVCPNSFNRTQDGICWSKTEPVDALARENATNCMVSAGFEHFNCIQCEAGYVNVGGFCREESDASYLDPNCESYSTKILQNYKSVCEVCKPGFYKKSLGEELNLCAPIPIENCKTYVEVDSSTEYCQACKKGFGLVKIQNHFDDAAVDFHCLPMGDGEFEHDEKCEELVGYENAGPNTDHTTSIRLKCNECKFDAAEPFVLMDISSDPTLYDSKCYFIRVEVEHCKNYEVVAGNINTSHWRCKECEEQEEYWLNRHDNLCVERQHKENCASFDLHQDACLTCDTGYFLNQEGRGCTSFQTFHQPAYVNSCSKLEFCEADILYEGLDVQLTSIFSCHKCSSDGLIPFAAVRLDEEGEVEGLRQFNENFVAYRADNFQVNKEELNIKCLPKPNAVDPNLLAALQANFAYTAEAGQELAFPSNCALGLVNTNAVAEDGSTHNGSQSASEVVTDLSKTTIRCAQCEPGYKATYAKYEGEEQKYFVSSCSKIQYCQEHSLWFNACSQCESGYTFGYKYGRGVQYDQCTAISSQNRSCYAYDTDNQRCVYCKQGTFMNLDGICEVIHPPNCKFRKFSFGGQFRQEDIFQGLGYENSETGCTQCEDGFVAVYQAKPMFMCTHSMYHELNSFVDESKYIPNCQNYTFDHRGVIQCVRCKPDFAISPIGRCYSTKSSELSNCVQATSETLCDVCEAGYVLLNRKCVSTSIENCAKFWNNRERDPFTYEMCHPSEQICVKCEMNYYLDQNKCKLGKVQNCEELDTATRCRKCKFGFTLVEKKGGEHYCYENDPESNCEEYDLDYFQSNTLKCKKCAGNLFVVSERNTQQLRKGCAPFTFVEHCLYYDNQQTISQSGFNCQECEEMYYLDENSNTCKPREVIIDECLVYQIKADKCEECKPGHYFGGDKTACDPYPQGIYGCDVYRSKTSCKACQTEFYLKNELCHPVVNKIENCVDYLDEFECDRCADGYVIYQDLCIKAEATNCLTYMNKNTCLTCQEGYSFKEEGINLNCVPISISQCTKTSPVAPFQCLECASEYILTNDNLCEAVSTKITNCVEYKDQTTCLRCSGLTALSSDGSACLDSPEVVYHLDLNCNHSVIPEQPICNTCSPGYNFLNGVCTACTETTIQNGCVSCDPKEPEICLMCQSGYIQTPEGDCIRESELDGRKL